MSEEELPGYNHAFYADQLDIHPEDHRPIEFWKYSAEEILSGAIAIPPQYEHDQLKRVFEDEDLSASERLVMLAIFVMGYKTDEMLGKYCNLTPDAIKRARESLMHRDWLAGPEG